ncbi:MAG: VWA domain-containing protein [Acidobacteriota bacterium]
MMQGTSSADWPRPRSFRRVQWLASLLLVSSALWVLAAPPVSATDTAPSPDLWPEEQRAFFQDGPALLLGEAQQEQLLAAGEEERADQIERFWQGGPEGLEAAVERRRGLIQSLGLSPIDTRAQVLFLQGLPDFREVVDCGQAFRPLEIWGYDDALAPGVAAAAASGRRTPEAKGERSPGRNYLILYRPNPGSMFDLWRPTDSKRVLYTQELEYFLEQWEELRGYIRGRRFDRQACEEAELVDAVTGIDGLFGFTEDRPRDADMVRFLQAPDNLGAWIADVLAEDAPKVAEALEIESLKIQFPQLMGQRIETRFTVRLPDASVLALPESSSATSSDSDSDPSFASTEGAAGAESDDSAEEPAEVLRWDEELPNKDDPQTDVLMEVLLEQRGTIFDAQRIRFRRPPTDEALPMALVAEEGLRPGQVFVARILVRDQVSGAEGRVVRGFQVPQVPQPVVEPPVPEQVLVALGESLAESSMAGEDSLVLIPPEADVILGLWKAEALVTGERIRRVAFFVDGKQQLKRSRPPFSVEVRLSQFPTEQVVRAEGYDSTGELVAADEVILNQPRGALQVRILEPSRGAPRRTEITASAEVVVPEGRRVESVEFLINDESKQLVESPPWSADLDVPTLGDLVYLTVVATLDDGSRAEDVRFLASPEYLEEVDVNLVELYTTVADRDGRLVKGLQEQEFEVLEAGRRQEISKFELVEDLPLTLGLTIDVSGSMASSLYEAQLAASGFIENIITRKDRAFTIAFSNRPVMLMPPTDDVGALKSSLDGLLADGWTSLHDAVVQSLYYFRGVRGRRALVVLSDGDDTASSVEFREALEYSRRSGVSIYTIGLGVSGLDLSIRNKLSKLSKETGGRSFFIQEAAELQQVYDEIEEELRSQYLLAYTSNNDLEPGTYVEVEVKVDRRGVDARTVRGVYQ